MWLIIIDVLFFITILVLLSRWKQEGTLTAERFAIVTATFWSFLDLTLVLAFAQLNWMMILVGATIAIIQFAIGYPVTLWIGRKIY